jgi:hypothetical protein
LLQVCCLKANPAQEVAAAGGRTTLWSVPAQLISYPHQKAEAGSYPCWTDTTEAQLSTVFVMAQVLDRKGGNGGCPQKSRPLTTTTNLK